MEIISLAEGLATLSKLEVEGAIHDHESESFELKLAASKISKYVLLKLHVNEKYSVLQNNAVSLPRYRHYLGNVYYEIAIRQTDGREVQKYFDLAKKEYMSLFPNVNIFQIFLINLIE